MSLEVENLQESVPDLRLLYRTIEKRCLLKEYWGLFRGHLYLTSSGKEVFGKNMSALSISLGYQLKRRERRKSVVLKNRCKKGTTIIKVCTRKLNSIMKLNAGNPGPIYVNELPLS